MGCPLSVGQCEAIPLFGENYFEEGEGFYTTESKQIDFMQAMHMFSKQDSPHVLKQLDLKSYSSACDLGGKWQLSNQHYFKPHHTAL